MDTKLVIVVRKDLRMRRGKEIAQSIHAAIAFLANRKRKLNKVEKLWLGDGSAVIALQINSEEELLDVHYGAKSAGLASHLVRDSGKTEFAGQPTFTCLAIGPDCPELIDPITGYLKLY